MKPKLGHLWIIDSHFFYVKVVFIDNHLIIAVDSFENNEFSIFCNFDLVRVCSLVGRYFYDVFYSIA